MCRVLYLTIIVFIFFFFFSSRRRHTRCSRDWSSDVCSSDLSCAVRFAAPLPLGLLVIGSAIGCRSRAERPAADKATTGAPVVADPLGRDQDAGELYFGVSRQRIAWLVYLNRQTRSGVLYEPLGTVSLCDVHLGPGDTLSFQSAVVTGAYYG